MTKQALLTFETVGFISGAPSTHERPLIKCRRAGRLHELGFDGADDVMVLVEPIYDSKQVVKRHRTVDPAYNQHTPRTLAPHQSHRVVAALRVHNDAVG